MAPEARAAMLPWMSEKFANPHATHKLGREAAAMVEMAREAVSALLPPGGKLWFTSGATEALNWALRCAGQGGIAIPDTEHAAVRDTALWLAKHRRRLTILPVGSDGLIDAKAAIPESVGVIAAMLVNNEIGVIQPVTALAKKAHKQGALFLCDAVQAYGRMAIPEGPDLIAISAHKIHGPKACHNSHLRAAMVPDLRALKNPTDAAYWRQWISGGRPGASPGSMMPAFAESYGGPLNDQQVTALVDFMVKAFPNRTIPAATLPGAAAASPARAPVQAPAQAPAQAPVQAPIPSPTAKPAGQ